MLKKVSLGEGEHAFVDEDGYERTTPYPWCRDGQGYAYSDELRMSMHRYLANPQKWESVHHINTGRAFNTGWNMQCLPPEAHDRIHDLLSNPQLRRLDNWIVEGQNGGAGKFHAVALIDTGEDAPRGFYLGKFLQREAAYTACWRVAGGDYSDCPAIVNYIQGVREMMPLTETAAQTDTAAQTETAVQTASEKGIIQHKSGPYTGLWRARYREMLGDYGSVDKTVGSSYATQAEAIAARKGFEKGINLGYTLGRQTPWEPTVTVPETEQIDLGGERLVLPERAVPSLSPQASRLKQMLSRVAFFFGVLASLGRRG